MVTRRIGGLREGRKDGKVMKIGRVGLKEERRDGREARWGREDMSDKIMKDGVLL